MILSGTKNFLKDICTKRGLIIELAKRDFQKQNMGSYLGFIWVFLQPLMFIGVLYMVFTLGFRAGRESGGVPFSLYLISGIIAWFFFSRNLSSGCNTINEYSFLLKKVDFRLSILPVVKLLSLMVPHIFFIFLAISLSWFNGFEPSLYTFQFIYYLFSMCMLLLGLGWLTSSTSIFVKDVNNIVRIIIQFGFWLTPIFWNISRVPEEYQWLIKFNPVYYVVNGYRDSLLYQVWFWEHPYETLCFWTETILILFLGIIVFKKLRPHFAEVV